MNRISDPNQQHQQRRAWGARGKEVSNELKPCPFCGEKPVLPDGDGTQYEIECGGCGQAMASVQICDLMTIEERAYEEFTNYRYAEEFVDRAKAEAIANWNRRAQPAEAEGVEVVGFLYKNNGQALTAADMDADTFTLMARSDFDGEVEKLVRQSAHLAALSAVTAERDRLQRNLNFTEQWYATRFERLADLGKSAGCWDVMAAIIANGTADQYEPPTYAQQLVRANHRAAMAERERDQLRAEVERMRPNAERYLWLRDAGEEDVWDATNICEPRFNGFGGPSTDERPRTGKAMDHFIDAAMAAKEG